MSDRLPDRMPDHMSDRMPEDMPDRMSEYMSEKCGIYRIYVQIYILKCHGGDHTK
jgi:hypothetical protein